MISYCMAVYNGAWLARDAGRFTEYTDEKVDREIAT